MPRTRAQRGATQTPPLGGLNDDALRRVLTFLSVSDSRGVAGEASKALRAVATSNELARLRGSESYVLHGSEHGVVHALATAFGTQLWRRVKINDLLGFPHWKKIVHTSMPPSRLQITAHRVQNPERESPSEDVFPIQVVDRDSTEELCSAVYCAVEAGTFAEFQLPFQVELSSFCLGHDACSTGNFVDWVFEAFDGERWHVLYECGESPWRQLPFNSAGPTRRFDVDATGVASSRFRLRMLDPVAEHGDMGRVRCMHIRALELFGTVLPPWSV